MRKRISFQKLRRDVPIARVCLNLLQLHLKQTGNQYRGACPLCEHDSDRCFVVIPSKNLYYCFGHCRSGGDALQLVARLKQLTLPQAARLIADWYGADL